MVKPLPFRSRFSRGEIEAGLNHLRAADPILKKLIHTVGDFRLVLERDYFNSLVYAIISQQISGRAARSIHQRVSDLLAPAGITPERLVRSNAEELRSAGISTQKASSLLDLAEKVVSGNVRLKKLPRLSDEAIIEELIQVKGIGVWTAQMFLIFSLGRLDVFPHADLGIRMALRQLYGLAELPDKSSSFAIAQAWRPYATLASWYCWRSLELPRQKS